MSALSPAGLTIDSINDIIAALTVAMQSIYGPDINVDSNSPDGQLINIYAQVAADTLELILDVYNSFAVDAAYGTVLDQRVALNGLARRQGTHTTTPVAITTDRALTLNGLDALVADPTALVFTVQDNANNQFALQTTQVITGPGTASYTFQAVAIGPSEVTPNTIVNQVTTVLGVITVNNPTTAGTSVGISEETDAQLKIRHAQSFALASTGPADAVEAAIAAIPDVTDALVVENYSDATVAGTAPHTIWSIVTGGTATEIAAAIYAKKGIGCGMRGTVTHVVARPNGTSFVAAWDTSIAQALKIRFTINPLTQGQSFDTAAIAVRLAAALIYKLGQAPNVGDIVTAMATIAPTSYQTSLGVSRDGGANYFDVVQPTTAQYYFTVAAADIAITQ